MLFLCVLGRAVAGADKKLSPVYEHWLRVEVPYIIESEERATFLALPSDAERDNFIQQFWESRNPTPGTGDNPYRAEHYRRLAYANEHYGDPKLENGWRTDQGRVYITLGAPQQVYTYPIGKNVRPMVAWFYQSPSPALPSYFYVLFYKRSIGEPYTLYSPYQDGPARLITGLEALNDQTRALKQLRQSMGDEVARLAVTLIPSEPANLNEYSPGMTSDSMLATIRGLPDNYLEKRAIANNRRREHVTASIYTATDTPSVDYMVARDDKGQSTVNYLIQFPEADSSIIGERKDRTVGYDMTLRSHIVTESGKPVYDEVDVLSGHLEPGQVEVGRKKRFSAEERFPLAPGTYQIESTLTNNLNLQAHRLSEKVVVPAPASSRLGVSEPVVYAGRPAQVETPSLPFTFSGVRFTPQAIHSVQIHPGDPLSLMFQLWLPKTSDGAIQKQPVQLHYAFAAGSLTGKPIDESDETVEAANFDAQGNLLTGHTLHTSNLAVGTYRLIIRATQAGSAPAASSLTVHVVPSDVLTGTWTAYGPPQPSQDDSKRTLSAKAQGLPR